MSANLFDLIPKYSKWLAVLSIFAIVTGIIYVNRSSAWQILKPFVTKQDDAITELYFTDYSSLPKKISVNAPHDVGFTIVNHEGKKETYKYQAVITEGLSEASQPPQSVDLEDGQSKQLQIIFTPHQQNMHGKVAIYLLDMDQSIQYSYST